MRPPVIGLTTYPADEENRYMMPRPYVDGVRRAGGIPMLITPGEQHIDTVLEVVDGLVLIGGGDIDPQRFDGESHPSVYNLSPERDALEIELANAVLDRQIPALGICRGMQIVTVALGGTLNVHVPDVHGEDVAHRAPPRDPVTHVHHVDEDSRLANILGSTRFPARSWHHQSVRDVPDGFKIVGHADDGCAEAMESERYPKLMCVQWHPELSAGEDSTQQRLFDHLIEMCREQRDAATA